MKRYYAQTSSFVLHCPRRFIIIASTLAGLVLVSCPALAQTEGTPVPGTELKKLSLEELMNIEVTSVSKRPEKLTEVASAIQVITSEDIRRSGATCVPEALRLASNLHVAQVNSSQWAISARGFNNVLANKLLVLIDGRTVYTPLYAGVFWDIQNLLLEDVEQIEVISGPGGTLWGANAVNGVINITTKSAKKTQGLFAEAGIGSELKRYAGLRYGGTIAKDISYRVYAMGFERGSTINTDTSAHDGWKLGQGGLRVDWDPEGGNNQVTLLSSYYNGRPNPDGRTAVIAKGGNVIGRWTHTYSGKADSKLQLYYDQTLRDFQNGFAENLKTYDLDWQHRFGLGRSQEVVWGAGIRFMDHNVQNLEFFNFLPGQKWLHLYNVFIQDRVTIVKDRLNLTLGSKFEHNSYTGFQYQPSCRLSWTPTGRHTVWTAVSRAVRNPSRIDRDFHLLLAPGFYIFDGGNVISETLLAYELGWRFQPQEKISFSLATFYNFYDYLRTAEPSPSTFPIVFENGLKGTSYGAELSGQYQATSWWRLRGGYTYFRKKMTLKPGSHDSNGGTAESDDPNNQYMLQSMMDIPGGLEVGAVLRFVDVLPKPYVQPYYGIDVRVSMKIVKAVELNLVGQNLFAKQHTEFEPTSPSPRQLERGVFGKINCRF